MARPYGVFRATCSHPGCKEFARYEADTRAHYIELEKRYGIGKWFCVRHSRPNEVLSADNIKIVDEQTIFVEPYGHFWGKNSSSNGFAHGPGYKAFAEDFPPGTILRVTAEIILPAEERDSSQ